MGKCNSGKHKKTQTKVQVYDEICWEVGTLFVVTQQFSRKTEITNFQLQFKSLAHLKHQCHLNVEICTVADNIEECYAL